MSDRIVYIVDDDASIRESTAFFLSSAGFSTKGFGSGQRFLLNLGKLQSGCVLLDIAMPGLDGFQVIGAMTPNLTRFPIVVMTGHGNISTAVRAMKLGACDFVEKPFDEQVILRIFDHVFPRLETGMSTELRQRAALARVGNLTGREAQVLGKMLAGRRTKEIAHEMGLSIRTIDTQRASMMESLGVRSSAEALRIAFEAGIDGCFEPTAEQRSAAA